MVGTFVYNEVLIVPGLIRLGVLPPKKSVDIVNEESPLLDEASVNK